MKDWKKRAVVLMLALSGVSVRAAQWIDVTEQYIVNPNFLNNSNEGWTMEGYAGSTACNYACQEFWQGIWNFYQTVELPNGHYRISVNGYHRPSDNSAQAVQAHESGEETISSMLYANDVERPMRSIYSENLGDNNYSNACWGYATGNGGYWGNRTYVYYPNQMVSAAYCFAQGMYLNAIEVDVEDGTLNFGIRNEQYVASNWCIFTNWRLEVYTDPVLATTIKMNVSRHSMNIGDQYQLAATLMPKNVTIPKLTWTSSDESVATVDATGLVMAMNEGSATIAASTTDGSNLTAKCVITVNGNGDRLANLVFTEIQSANIDQTVDPSWNFGGWAELYNPNDQSVSLRGCWVSDEPANLQKVHISQIINVPAQGYRNLWFDHHDKYCLTQVDMKLNVEGGTLYLSDPDGQLICSVDYPPAVARCAYARKSLSADEWAWTSTPTPEYTNDEAEWAEVRLPAPEVDQPTQIFGSSLTVCVNIPNGATLRYTTDGSTPTADNGETSEDGLFYPNETTIYRFCLIGQGYLPSPVVTRTYILEDKTFDLPVISVVGNDRDLYGSDMGIMVKGNGNGRPGNGQATPCNWNMDWERSVNFEYLNTEGEMVINQETAMERCGGWSRAWIPYAFKIKANKQYELQNTLPYQFFDAKPYLKHKTLQMRNGGNDTQCRIKDPALQEIVFRSGIDIDCQAYQPVMHYINGKYAGVINMREPNNKHYIYANYGLDDDEIDQFEMSPDSGYIQKCGTYESMQRWYDLAEQCGTDDEAYDEICQMVDIDEYCNYMAVEMYLGNWDWPQNNVKGWKPVMEGGKFRFVLFDLDGSLNTTDPFNAFAGKRIYTFDKLYGEPMEHIQKEIEFVTIFQNMLQCERFRKQFIDTYCLVTGSVFEPNRCNEIINELANRVSDSQNIYNQVYWQSSTPWNTANTLISQLSKNRQTTMMRTLRNYQPMQLSSVTPQHVQLSSNLPEARLLVNGLPVPTNRFDGQLFAPITIKAQAPAGYKFAGWQQTGGNNSFALLSKESTWEYYDQGSLDGEDWTANDYDQSQWQSGQAPLGYFVGGDRYTNTYLDYGGNANSKRPTYYFRHQVHLDAAPKDYDLFQLNYTIDDGFIIYVNGQEAGRYNMPSGEVGYDTFASSYAPGNPDSGTLQLPASLFQQGDNTLAVEIHNNQANSTDIYWEAELIYSTDSEENRIVSTDETYTIPEEGDLVLVASYEPMSEAERREAGLSDAPVVVNEVSAGNSIYINEYEKKDDWIELYNTTDNDIDLEGMYLSDRSDNPKKCQITAHGTKASTIIPAHGYKIIWCSKRDTDTELHTNFKLENVDGTVVRLMASDSSWADSLVYCAHNGDQTVGRYPDGGAEVYLMTQPTISKANKLNTYAKVWTYTPDTLDTGLRSMVNRTGSMSIAYSGTELLVKSEEHANIVVCVYTTTGALVMRQPITLDNSHMRIGTSVLPNGIYVARAKDSEGNECATKFLKQ